MRDVRTLPKAHLHVHLESTVRPETLRDLAVANGVASPAGEATLGGFAGFFALNERVRACLRRPGDFRRIAFEYCADEATQGTRYAEVSFTAAAHGERVGEPDMPLENVLAGFAEGREAYGIECRLLLDHSRRRSVERAWRTLDLATEYATRGVVGVGLAGDETYPGEPFDEVFAAARDRGVHVVHHAGEACGADSIRQAVTTGRAERIGHGIRILDDAALVAQVRDRGIPLEVCPSSNVALGFVPSLAAHPLPRLRDAGLRVTVNADIPATIGTTQSAEYAHVRDEFGYGDADLADLARAGVDASFADAATKDRLHRDIDTWLADSAP